MRSSPAGNAVINSYCKSDLQPSFNRAYSGADVVNSGVVNEITLVLENVKNSCHGNGGKAPCATDAGADRWPSFVCTFTDYNTGQTVNSAAVQAVRNLDIVAGQMLGQEDTVTVSCEIPSGWACIIFMRIRTARMMHGGSPDMYHPRLYCN
jgi:hypothetical protein